LLQIALFAGSSNDFGFLGGAKIVSGSLSNAFVKSTSGSSLALFFFFLIGTSDSPDEVGVASKSKQL
jgi:hypothetical protein